jgi:ferric-dicitrate binding protein FerR (iron transport regulator)
MNYLDYTAIDFAMDHCFQQWVLQDDPEASEYWRVWLELHPEKKSIIQEARDLLKLQSFASAAWPEERAHALQQRITQSIQQEEYQPSPSPGTSSKKGRPINRYWLAVAASLLLTLSIVIFFFVPDSYASFSTAYGETRSLQLPDGTAVTLNANSTLQFEKDWQQTGHRQVWLEGEGYFKVATIASTDAQQLSKFTVHLDELDVEVVGTAFNANHRCGRVEVTLEEGIVEIRTMEGAHLRMKAGEKLAYSTDSRQISRSLVNPKHEAAWLQKQIIVQNQPLSDLAGEIREYYGIEVRFSSKELAAKKITATLPVDELDVILASLETIYGVQSEIKGKIITFR